MPADRHRLGCQREDHPAIGRRRLIQAGGVALFGMGMADLFKLEAHARQVGTTRRASARSVVFIFQSGGPSQLETWDPKPGAPAEIRGEYGTTATRTTGLRICEYLPRLAARSDRYTIVRTMHHPAPQQLRNEHDSATYMLHTGMSELPPGEMAFTIRQGRQRRFEWPSIASTIAYALPRGASLGLPPTVQIPRSNLRLPGTTGGMLGTKYVPWSVDLAPECHAPDPAGSCPNCFSHDQPDDPARAPGKQPGAWWDNSSCRNPEFHLPNLGLDSGLSLESLKNRAALLDELDRTRRNLDENVAVQSMDDYRRQAWNLIFGQKGKLNPFDLHQEPDRVRDLYGREEWGQAFLVARRLVEAGVRMVQVNLRNWDTHQNAFRDLKGKLLPSLDHCLSGFLDDLDERGLLDETLVVMCGEMGRTPRISAISGTVLNAAGVPFTPGRHHWGDVFPCFLAGGGIQPGRVVGQTDKFAGQPMGTPYKPGDLAATIFHLMGIEPTQVFSDAQSRPHRIYQGQPITEAI